MSRPHLVSLRAKKLSDVATPVGTWRVIGQHVFEHHNVKQHDFEHPVFKQHS